jgi:hypothetical protein
METAYDSENGGIPDAARLLQDIDDARVAAAGNYHKTLRRIENQGHVLGQVIFGF